ncbi:hypothetical protein [Saccharopolyspora gregorii]|uniref:Uncharacterized protein n=1 Tax=Saccharopolyspora gregorii TaxID=33914 RepID=A0ABP6RR03_9PSEU
MNDEELYAELLRRLQGRAHAADTSSVSMIEFSPAVDGVSTGSPVRLHVTPVSLGDHLRAMASDGDRAFPGEAPLIGALQLFLVHIDEAVNTRQPGQNDLVVKPGGVWALSPDEL